MNLESAIRYREKILPEKLFEKIIPVFDTPTLNILVIGAGNFPSYTALVKKLDVKNLSFTLIEPISAETDFFLSHFADKNHRFTFFNGELKDFLNKTSQTFDLIYFEHPETMTVPIVLSKIGFSRFNRVTSLREAMPLLFRVVHANTLIIGSCMSRHELSQLKNLLNFSLKTKPLKIHSSMKHVFYGGPYCEGISYVISTIDFRHETQQKKSNSIRWSDQLLFLVLLMGLIIYIFYCARFPNADHALERLIAIVLIGAQLHYHRPGKKGGLIKCILLCMQFSL